jgi:hypothetical protein
MTRRNQTIEPTVVHVSDTTVIPASTMTRDRLIRMAAEAAAARRAAIVNDRAAALAAGAAEVAVLMGLGAFGAVAGKAIGVRPDYSDPKAMTAYFNGMCAQATARGLTTMKTASGKTYAIRPRKAAFTAPYSLNKIVALEAVLAH